MGKSMRELVEEFLKEGPYAVVGASTNREKYGNKVLRSYQQNNKTVYPVNPRATEIEGLKTYPNLSELPEKVEKVSLITPPEITEKIVEEASKLGIKYLWMQPGAESPKAIQRAEELNMEVIAKGPCVLVMLNFRDES